MPVDDAEPRPRINRLCDWVRMWANRNPDAEAAVEPGRRLTYAMLADAIDECAAAMVVAGIKRGDRVAALTPPGLDFLVTFLATGAIGGIWVGLNPRYTERELDAVIKRIEPRLLFAVSEIEARSYRGWAGRLATTIPTVELGSQGRSARHCTSFSEFIASASSVAHAQLKGRYARTQPDDPCMIVFTSGSTGAPKGAMISHAALVGTSRVQLRQWPARPLRVLDNLPINHIGCVGDLSCYALVGGGKLIFTPRFDPATSLRLIRDEKITVWGQVPTMFQLTLEAPAFDPDLLASLQLIFWGGAHASPQLIEGLRRLAPRLATSYGQTETVGSVTFTSPDADMAQLQHTVGHPVEPYKVRIVDADGLPLASGGEGEIQVRTPFGMAGYWRDPTATAAAVTADGWRRTGDVGTITPEGALKLLGRVHDVFKSGGYNIYPPEIEAALAAHPALDQAAVVAVPDPLYGNVAVAFAVTAGPAPSAGDLRGYLHQQIANYKVPKRFIFVDALPRLPVGKVDKQALQTQALTIK